MFGGDEDDSASAAGGRVVADDEDGGDGGSSTMGDTETPRVVGFVLHQEQGGQGDTEPDLLQQARKLQAAVVVDMHNAALENTAALSLCTSAQVSEVGGRAGAW